MSTLKTFGFSVRRRRNQDTTTSNISKPDKLSSSTDTSSRLAFAATSPESINTLTQPNKKTIRSSLSKQSTTNIKSTTRHSPKDPKQAILAPFFVTPTQSISTSSSTEEGSTHTQEKDQTQRGLTTGKRISTQSDSDEIELCRVRRAIPSTAVLLVLEETFGGNTYDNTIGQQQRKLYDNTAPLLQIKPNKVIYLPAFEMMDNDDDNNNNDNNEKFKFGTITHQRRQFQDQCQGNKRLCVESSSGQNQQRIYSFMDEFDTQQEGDIEIKAVRHSLSSAQMGSLLLDIANEFMTFDNNSWCTSYITSSFD